MIAVLLCVVRALREVQRALPAPSDPNLYRMTINGEQRTMTLVEAVQHWKFERAKHQRGSATWRAYNTKLYEVGVRD